MAKILISSLGIVRKEDGTCKKAKYTIDGQLYETSFIADVLTKHLNIDWLFHFILPPVSLPVFHFFESQTSM